MRYLVTISILLLICTALFFSCAKWKDPAPVNDPRLTNPYCNDPAAVNYNWGFPGKPDSTVCFYPNSLFVGTYTFHDSIYNDTLFIGADSFTITISSAAFSYPLAHTKMLLSGICGGGGGITLTALPGYQATVDTNAGDTATLHQGQIFCRPQDTLSGYINRDRLDSPTVLHIFFQVASDTNVTTHYGSAILKQ